MATQTNLFAAVAGSILNPKMPGTMGVFRRQGWDGDWRQVLTDIDAYTVLVHPDDPSLVLAGTGDGVWRSTDAGATFARAGFPESKRPESKHEVWSFLVDARNPRRILAGASPIGIFLSEDMGASWRQLPTPKIPEHCKGPFANRVMRLVQHPKRPAEIYAALEINGVMRSGDGGETWSDCSAHLIEQAALPHLTSALVTKNPAEGMLDGHAITICPAEPDAVVLACRMGLFRSVDHGKTWADMNMKRFSPVTYGRDIRASAQDPATMYAALSVAAASKHGGLYRSRDAGQTWSRFDKVQVHGTIMSVGLSARDASQVYLGARYGGEVFGTRDGGTTWAALPLPGQVKDIYAVVCG